MAVKKQPKRAAKKAEPKAKAKAKVTRRSQATRFVGGKAVPKQEPAKAKAKRISPEPEPKQKPEPKPEKVKQENEGGSKFPWTDPQELLDQSQSPGDLIRKALLLKQFTDAEIADMVKAKFSPDGAIASSVGYVGQIRSEINRRAYHKGVIDDAESVLGNLLPLPKYVRDEKENLVEKVREAAA